MRILNYGNYILLLSFYDCINCKVHLTLRDFRTLNILLFIIIINVKIHKTGLIR